MELLGHNMNIFMFLHDWGFFSKENWHAIKIMYLFPQDPLLHIPRVLNLEPLAPIQRVIKPFSSKTTCFHSGIGVISFLFSERNYFREQSGRCIKILIETSKFTILRFFSFGTRNLFYARVT